MCSSTSGEMMRTFAAALQCLRVQRLRLASVLTCHSAGCLKLGASNSSQCFKCPLLMARSWVPAFLSPDTFSFMPTCTRRESMSGYLSWLRFAYRGFDDKTPEPSAGTYAMCPVPFVGW